MSVAGAWLTAPWLTDLAAHWGQWKIAIEAALDMSPDALHVQFGIVLLAGFALMLRRPLGSWVPWSMVLIFELINEYIDLNQPAGSIESNWPASQHDILNTMFAPTLIVLFLKWQQRSKRPDGAGSGSVDGAAVVSEDAVSAPAYTVPVAGAEPQPRPLRAA